MRWQLSNCGRDELPPGGGVMRMNADVRSQDLSRNRQLLPCSMRNGGVGECELECWARPGDSSSSSVTSHCQDDAELRFPAHHASVAFSRLRQRVLFDHGANATHFRKPQPLPPPASSSSR